MPINSRAKGARGELEAALLLRKYGFDDARRSVQYSGKGGQVGDIVAPETLPLVHIEVKYGYNIKRFNTGTDLWRSACAQAERDCPSKHQWCVLWRPSGASWWRISYELKPQDLAPDCGPDSTLKGEDPLLSYTVVTQVDHTLMGLRRPLKFLQRRGERLWSSSKKPTQTSEYPKLSETT